MYFLILSSFSYTTFFNYTKTIILKSPDCNDITKSGSYSMNKNINIPLADGLDSSISNSNYQVKIL